MDSLNSIFTRIITLRQLPTSVILFSFDPPRDQTHSILDIAARRDKDLDPIPEGIGHNVRVSRRAAVKQVQDVLIYVSLGQTGSVNTHAIRVLQKSEKILA
jgi:hypothetical protein